jgi:uncharacterized Zn-finger protein
VECADHQGGQATERRRRDVLTLAGTPYIDAAPLILAGTIDPMTANPAPKPETILVDGHRVSCDGGGGALGHPKVFLELGEDDVVECGYCDRRFVKKGSEAAKQD